MLGRFRLFNITNLFLILFLPLALGACTGVKIRTLMKGKTPLGPMEMFMFVGAPGGAGDVDGVGSTARIGRVNQIVRASDSLFYALDDCSIRSFSPVTGEIKTLVGVAKDCREVDGDAHTARLSYSFAMTLDSLGNLYVAGNGTVRKVTPAGDVSTLAGASGISGYIDAVGSNARFGGVVGIASDGINVFVADAGNSRIRKIAPDGTVTTIGTTGIVPACLVLHSDGSFYYHNGSSSSFRKMTLAGVVTTLTATPLLGPVNYLSQMTEGPGGLLYFTQDAGGSPTNLQYLKTIDVNTGAVAIQGQISYSYNTSDTIRIQPLSTAFTSSGDLYLGGVSAIFKFDPLVSSFNPFIGKLHMWGEVNGSGTSALFSGGYQEGIAVDSKGNVFVSDNFGRAIRKITPAGVVTSFAGQKSNGYGAAAGTGTAAKVSCPTGIAIDSHDNLYVGDECEPVIYKITPAAVVTIHIGSPGSSGHQDGLGAAARIGCAYGLAVDPSDNLYFADDCTYVIRKVTPDGNVTTLAGVPGSRNMVDGGAGVGKLQNPYGGITVARDGSLIFSDDKAVRRFNPGSGLITTIAGSTTLGFLDANGTNARFGLVYDVMERSDGSILVLDENSLIRSIDLAGKVTTLIGSYPHYGFKAGTALDSLPQEPSRFAYDSVRKRLYIQTNNEGNVSYIANFVK